ncbi:MAG: ricin-type beta-trefoil lectin domain protein [Jatrophihabitantaceae bacterium]
MRLIAKFVSIVLATGTLVGLHAATADAATANSGPVRSGVLGKCLDVLYSNPANGTPVQLFDCNGQSWSQNDDGTLTDLGKCLQPVNGGTAQGTQVELWDCTGASYQVWQPYNGGYLNSYSGLCLDDPSSSQNNYTRLQLYRCNGTNAQQWSLPNGQIGSYRFGAARDTLQAERYNAQSGTGVHTLPGGQITQVDYISNGDWLRFDNVQFFGESTVNVIAEQAAAGTVEVHLDSMNNTPSWSVTGPIDGGQYGFVSHYATKPQPVSGYHTVYLRFVSNTDHFINVDWFTFS